LVEDAATARELSTPARSYAVAATFFVVREAAGWHERRVHLADLRSECQPVADRPTFYRSRSESRIARRTRSLPGPLS